MSFIVRIRGMVSDAGMGVRRASRGESKVEKQDLVSERPMNHRKRRRRRRPAPDQNPLAGDPSGPKGPDCPRGEEHRVDIII